MIINDTVNLKGLLQDLYFKGKFTSATFPKNDLLRIINTYYKIAQEDLRAVNEDFFLITAKADLQAYSVSQGTYTFPLDYEKIKSYWVATQPVSASAPLYSEYVRCQVIDANSITNPSYAFSNPTIINYGTYFVLVPQLINNASITYPVIGGMKVYYIPVQADLVNDTDAPLIFPDYHDVITWGALIDIAQRLGKPDLKAQAEKMWKMRRKEMKADASNRILSVESEYVEGQTAQGGWSFKFGNSSGI